MEGKKEPDGKMRAVEVLLDTGWSWQTYQKQPRWLIEHIEARRVAENRIKKFKNKYGGQ